MKHALSLTVVAFFAAAALANGARAETALPAAPAAHAAPPRDAQLIDALRLKVDEAGVATERLILASAAQAIEARIARREPQPFVRPLVRPFAYAHLAP